MRVLFAALNGLLLWVNSSHGQVLDSILRNDTSQVVRMVLQDTAEYRLQIYFSEITTTSLPRISLRKVRQLLGMNAAAELLEHQQFRPRPHEYFFPASLVKLPVAIIALEKLQLLSSFGVTNSTLMMPLSDFQCKGAKTNKALSAYELVHRMFVYSHNESYNYLYEFCGIDLINNRLQELNFDQTRITEKIANCSKKEQTVTGPVAFYNSKNDLLFLQSRQNGTQLLPGKELCKVGNGYLSNGTYIAAPKDFSSSSFVPLRDFHQLLISLYKPDVYGSSQLHLSSENRQLLHKAMRTLPSAYCPDSCEGRTFPDDYVKYLFPLSDSTHHTLTVYNKVGLAHGFISDCAYVEDSENDLSFFLSAVLYVNKDGILNDGKYEYDTIGKPFLKRLGFLVHTHLLAKKISLNK